MRQVPKYLIVGNGRVARHLCHYFDLLKIKQYTRWDRSQPLARLHEAATDATHILLAIKDSAIEPFIDEHLVDLAPCAHIKMFNTALSALKKEITPAHVKDMEAALKSFAKSHDLNAASKRQMEQLEKTAHAVKDAASLKKLGDGLHALKAGLPAAKRIHFSGALVTKKAFGAHPLMTFGPELYTLEKYLAIPFVVDAKAPPFGALLPGLHNPSVRLSPQKKAKYHALCVMAGNFSCILWQKLFDSLADEFRIPPHTADMYLRQQTENLLGDYKNALTGPLARGDQDTIKKNLKSLEGDAFHAVYSAFIKAYTVKQFTKLKEKAS